MVTRGTFFLFKAQRFYQERFLPAIAPLSLIALLFTTLIIFAAQGRQVGFKARSGLERILTESLHLAGRIGNHLCPPSDRTLARVLPDHVQRRALHMQARQSDLRPNDRSGFHGCIEQLRGLPPFDSWRLRASLTRPHSQLAIAVAIAAYGADSPQALAATVGPLVE